jgi:glycosyltransferase involved in cell wall biosynthesis
MKVTIVTVCFNAATTLRDTLESVAHQTHPSIEHIVIDGGSTDATREIVRLHGSHLAAFVSEPDRGLYDAMNKGAARASGDVLAFLNADDWYAHPAVLAWVAERFDGGADLVYGDLDFVDPEPPFRIRRTWRDATQQASDFVRRGWQPAHPATFVRTELFRQVGGFDLRWKIGADYAFLSRCMSQPKLALQHLPRTLVNMRLGGASTEGFGAVWRANRECAAALRELGAPHPWTTIALKTLRKLPQKLKVARGKAAWRPRDNTGLE